MLINQRSNWSPRLYCKYAVTNNPAKVIGIRPNTIPNRKTSIISICLKGEKEEGSLNKHPNRPLIRIDMNLNHNEQELTIGNVSKYRIHVIPQKDFFLWIVDFIHFKYEFQISRILLRPINRAEVIVKAANRKPK